MREADHFTRLPLIKPDGRISRIRLSEAVLPFASSLSVGSMLWHPIQAASFPQWLTGALGSLSASDFGVILPQPAPEPDLQVPL